MIKGVIFDMDGVLVDNRDIHIEAFDIFSQRYGIKLPVDRLLETFGRGNDEIIPAIWPAKIVAKYDMQALSDEKEVIYRDIFHDRVVPTNGLKPFIKELKRRGCKLAVGSSGPAANVNFVLEKCGIASCFDAVVNGDMATRRKPDPQIYLLAAELLGLAPAECLVIEDALPGIEAAQRAGCSVAVLATTFPRTYFKEIDYDLISDDFTDLDIEAIAAL